MRNRNFVFILFFLFAQLAFATPTNPVSDAEYITLKTPQPVPEGKKIEVIEFFMYHCPACNMFEPTLDDWAQKHSDNIIFKRIPVIPHSAPKEVEAHLFYTLQAMQKEGMIKNFDELHKKIFASWHVERKQLSNDDKNIDWAVKNGIDKEQFVKMYNSAAVTDKLKELDAMASNYQVTSTPTLVIDGRYQTTMARVADYNSEISHDKLPAATLEVVDALIKKAQANKK